MTPNKLPYNSAPEVAMRGGQEGAAKNGDSAADWRIALAFTLGLRIVFSGIAAVLSFILHPDLAAIRSNDLTDNLPAAGTLRYAVLGVWERFDTLWYLHIAQHGYDQAHAVIFYPLYPIAIHVVAWLMPPITAALIVSTVATFFFFWGLLRLVSPLSPDVRMRVLLAIAVWPTSFIFFAGYAESLTLALAVWAVVSAREERWWLAALCGVLAGAGRPAGALISIPLLLLAMRRRQVSALPVFLSPAGLLAYWGWLRWTGRISVVEAYRQYQGANLAPPWASLAEVFRIIANQHDWLLAIRVGLVLVALAFSLRREVRLEDKLFSLAVVIQMMLYTGRPLLGAARYLLFVYPAFISMGEYAQKWSRKQLAFYYCSFAALNLAWMVAFLKWSLEL